MNAPPHSALSDAAALRAEYTGPTGYGLAYGSHATAATEPDSDLDLLLVTPHRLPPARVATLREAVIDLHHRHRLRLDTEVAYDIKLTTTPRQVREALTLRGFPTTPGGRRRAPAVPASGSSLLGPFLNSPTFKLRLVLNALSSPNVFLGGNLALYQRHQRAAETAVATLAVALLDPTARFTLDQATLVLTTGPDGAREKDYLGYTCPPALRSTLARGLQRLHQAGALATTDGLTWWQATTGGARPAVTG